MVSTTTDYIQKTNYLLINNLELESQIQKLNFEGDFFSLTKVLNQLQSTKGIGVPRAATFKVMGIRSNVDETKKLLLEVYLEIARQ